MGGETGIKISGVVNAPSGQLAKAQPKGFLQWFVSRFSISEGIAQSTGLAPVPSINILVFQIDDNGNPVGPLIASGTTDANGNFNLILPTGTPLSSDLIVQASDSTTPLPICTGTTCSEKTLDLLAVQTSFTINPAAELVTRVILQDIVDNPGTLSLSNFTPAEVAAFVSLVQIYAMDPTIATGTTIEEAITNIKNASQSRIDTALAGIDGPGETSPPTAFTVFQGTNEASARAFPLASDGTNFLVGLQVSDSTGKDHVKAQLVSPSGDPVASIIDTDRTGGVPFAAFDGTNYLMVWDDSIDYGNGISAQLVSSLGTLVGSTIPIVGPSELSATKLGLSSNAVSFDGNNYFIVFNAANGDDAVDLYGVFVSTSGARVGGFIPIVTADHQQRDYSVGYDGTNFLVVWEDGRRFIQTGTDSCTDDPRHLPTDTFGQFISKSSGDTAGSSVGLNFMINQDDFPSDGLVPSVAFDGTDYLVTWPDATVPNSTCLNGLESGERWGIYAQRLSTSGKPTGGTIPLATSDNNNSAYGPLAFGGNGYLLVATVSNDNTNGLDLHGQFIDKTGVLDRVAFVIDGGSQDQFLGNVLFAGGKFITVWTSGVAGSPGTVFGAFLNPP